MATRPEPFDTPTSIITFAQLAGAIRHRSPRLGSVRLVCVDGRAGAGKTTFAARLSAALDHCQVIHADDLYPGWNGLDAFGERLDQWVLTPLLHGRTGEYLRYDWHAGRYAESHSVPANGVLIVEGVGAAQRRTERLAVSTIWLDAAESERYRRGIERDGDDFRPYWRLWAEQEDRHFSAHDTRRRADLIVDGDPPETVDHDPETQLVVRRAEPWFWRPSE